MINYLKSLSITKLEWVLLTHLHADHYGGVSELVKQGYTINKFYIKDYSGYDNVDATTRSNNVHNIITKAGYSYTAIDSLPHTYADEVYLELGQFRFAIFRL